MAQETQEQIHKEAREGFSNAFNSLLTNTNKLGGNAYNVLHSEHRDDLLKGVQTALTELKKAGAAFDDAIKPTDAKAK